MRGFFTRSFKRTRKKLGCLLFQIIGALILVGLIWAAARAFEFYVTGG